VVRTVAIVQARMGSTRLPGKVMTTVCGVPLLGLLITRLSRARKLDEVVVATSVLPADDVIETYVNGLGYRVYRGSENDVLDRFYHAATGAGADIVVRITADCPLIDAELVDEVVTARERQNVSYASNTEPPTFPDGLDVEVLTIAALEQAWREARAKGDREHVTPFVIREANGESAAIRTELNLASARWTVDEPEDLELVKRIFAHFFPRVDFSWREVVALMDKNPDLFAVNVHIARNEGETMGAGEKLWKRANRVIAGGNMLLSKRPDMFLPGHWPTYFSKAKGCRIWDLDGHEYIDMSLMGVGTNTLGYGHPSVDAAVEKAIADGNMSTLNCPDEVLLAERLVEMHPWSDMVRLARTGGEANAVAVRIARAVSGRDRVAVCGYHGWHDWYLAANVGSGDRLASHLLPGLSPVGVPRSLAGSIVTFDYNRLDKLDALLKAYDDIGVIVMEPARTVEPDTGYLQGVRKLADERNIVLIFDECSAGFRETFGGLHLKYGVDPDMAVFGKALGNGYSITSVLGRRAVMEAAQDSFISSTFWTERIGPAAALATLDTMERLRSWEIITDIGKRVRSIWRELSTATGVELTFWGLPAMGGFLFSRPDKLECKTFLTQEMLARGYLATTSFYSCTEHVDALIERYTNELGEVLDSIAQGDVSRKLRSNVCSEGFKRLN
jgi:glutamate-1-semialdehyde 2,1-aminomutase